MVDDWGIDPVSCKKCEMVAYGPIFREEGDKGKHKKPRDKVAALEKKLRDTLKDVGYNVMNRVHSKQPLDNDLWEEVREAFTAYFPELAK